jgi:glycosyltransferase involved in cell wall biosynthesis
VLAHLPALIKASLAAERESFDSQMHSEPLLVSVVIPAFNEEKRLPQTVRHIREACDASPGLAGGYEIIVCDNNSTDATAAAARSCDCTVVLEPVKQISKARNRGASVASGQWLLFIDADSWPSPQLIEDMAPLLTSRDCIGCGSTIRVIDGPRWFKIAWESKNWSMRTFKWCPGGFILCRREAFSAIGGFSEEHYLFEELDFVRRLKGLAARRGQRFMILHKHPFSTSGRRATAFGVGGWMKFALRLSLFHKRSVRDKAFAAKWYEVDR